MPPRGNRGGPRGRGRGQGGRGGRGGRGRGRTSFARGPKFANARLADIEESETEISEEEVPSEDGIEKEESEDSDDEEAQTSKRPYLALMQSLARASSKPSAPKAKRRKLEHEPEKSQPLAKPEPEAVLDAEEQDVDRVEEPEEGPDDGIVADNDDDEEEEVLDMSDPFETHFDNPDPEELEKRLKAIESNEYRTQQSEVNGWKIIRDDPGKDSSPLTRLPTTISGPANLKLKHKLIETATKKRSTFDQLEQVLYPITFGYQDLLFCGRNANNAESLRRMACLHAVNHIFKTRDRVIKNNAKLAKDGDRPDFEPRDQGFTRPKVLMLLPTRNSAVHMVNEICGLCEPDQQENRKRFDESYVDREAKFAADRPEDFRELFDGNDDDMFRLGVKFTRKTVKYFAQFYNSDILMASPLGLRMAIGSSAGDGGKNKAGAAAGYDYDFLSSIELVVVDQADALLMQNWEHVEYVLEHLNLQPREAHGCDFGRVREWYLDQRARHFRQTLVLSAFNTPELSELHRQHGRSNWAGRARVQPATYAGGAIQDLGAAGGGLVRARQTFSRFEAPSIAAEPDARFAYFTSAVVPSLTKRFSRSRSRAGGGGGGGDLAGTLIFVPSYLDFVRVRNYFATSAAVEGLTFGVVSEYADVGAASRARSHFLSGRHQVLLYTGRAHHFRRYALRGVRRVVMYALPDNPVFYREIVGGFLGRSEADLRIAPGEGSVRVLFSKYDVLALERVVGSERVGRMIRERGDTFDFV
ncbi:hypothetical protein F4778DRAFT_795233 [Xylariomycetidae sp. FL2044]|nr:hypothetical protein F4778DRAFT_795233 [Xylariomycetidae sp. FL2044]